jgi:hypothetical protein
MLGKIGAMDVFLDGPDARIRDALHILWAGERVTADSIDFSPEITESEDTGDFQLITLPALVRMKLTSFRDKDRMHLRDLLDVGLIDASWTSKLQPIPALAERLQFLLDNPE